MNTNQAGSIVVFGATGGIGQSLSRRLSAAGKRVILVGRNPEKLNALAQELQADSFLLNAANSETFADAINFAIENSGSIQGIANCIGSVLLKPGHLTTDEEFWEVIRVNLGSSFAILRSAVKTMRSGGGSIVFVSSAAAKLGMPNHEAIAAAKGGIEGLAKSAAASYASRGIRVNVVAPGLVQTEMTRQIWENETNAKASKSMHALGRLGTPDDISSCISWLLDDASSWVTGQVVGVDGGLASVIPRRKG